MTDPRLAALAAVLRPLLPQHLEGAGGYPYQSSDTTWTVYEWMTPADLAAAILAALPPDWCGHGDENARLRAALERIARMNSAEAENDAADVAALAAADQQPAPERGGMP